MTNPLHNSLSVAICEDAADAIASGYDWKSVTPAVKPIEIKKVVVVRKGTKAGSPTVDILLEDETGQRFVCMVTGALLKSIPC